MTGDISAYLFDPRQAYSSVRLQQGRVITDLDWNENERIKADERLRLLAALVCSHGSTNDGFRLLGAQPASLGVPTGGNGLAPRATYDVALEPRPLPAGRAPAPMAAATARRHLPADVPQPGRLAAALREPMPASCRTACDRADRPRLPRSVRSPGPRRRGPRVARAGAGRPRHLDEAKGDPPGARPDRSRPGLPRRGGGAPPLAHPAPPGRHQRPAARVR